jgi:hypothetical protein
MWVGQQPIKSALVRAPPAQNAAHGHAVAGRGEEA